MKDNSEIIAYLSLGSNLDNPGRKLRESLYQLVLQPRVRLLSISPIYRTKPWGVPEQPDFFNMAVKIFFRGEGDAEAAAFELLNITQKIEQNLGRVRSIRWGARAIDIDIVHIAGLAITSEQLKLPHPYMWERAFVLQPLYDIESKLNIEEKSVKTELMRLLRIDAEAVTRTKAAYGPFPLKVIACVDEDNGIGRRGELLYNLPNDMRFFKEQTTGGIVIMGRKTMESLPSRRPLANRTNIVLSKTIKSHEAEAGFIIVPDLAELWQRLSRLWGEKPRNIWCIGGEECYRELLPFADEGFITRVEARCLADAFFPGLDDFYLAAVNDWHGLRIEHYRREDYEENFSK